MSEICADRSMNDEKSGAYYMTNNAERNVIETSGLGSGNIPYISNINLTKDSNKGEPYVIVNMEDITDRHDSEGGNAMSVSSWGQENDEQDGADDGGNGFDDNMSQVGSDYSEYPANETFAHPHPMSGERYSDELKYNPSEMMLGPPPSSAIQFSYNFPPVSSASQHPQHSQAAAHRVTAMPDPSLLPHMYNNQDEVDASTPANQTSQPHPSQNYIHPNMWYPNASISSYRSYGSHPYARHFGPQFSHDHMMDMFQMSNSGREARNRAEKNRRDKLNGSIQELSTMVPHVAESPRRVDKTAVLRFAAHGLRLKYVFGKSLNSRSVETTDALMKLLDSFFLTLTCNGQIVLVSSSIEQHLGHCQADLYGQNILHITHPEDHQMLKQKLIPSDIDNLFDIQPEDDCGEPRQRTQAEEDEIDRRLREDKRSFTIRLARSGPRSEATTYELVKIDGSFRRSDMAPRGLKTSTFPSTLQLMRRSRGREDILPMHTISGNDIVLIAIARIVRPPVINRSMEVNRLEYKTRHLIDGRIIDCDQRISLVAGYMTDEVRNLSPFTFMHQDDVRWVIVALRQMYDCNSSFGESTYRLFTGNGKIIYLHTKGFLEIDKNTNKVHSFICVNTLLDEEEGKRRVQSMKNKFSVIINTKIPQSSVDVPASENPQQLEKAVMCLIQNLQQSATDNEDFGATSSITAISARSQMNLYQHQLSHTTPPHVSSGRSSKTPPLALVPPAADSIKNSITKSVCVVKTTAGKFLRAQNTGCPTNNMCTDDSALSEGANCDHRHYLNQVDYNAQDALQSDKQTIPYSTSPAGPMKRKLSCSISDKGDEDDDEYRVPMQRKDIENVLSTSLQQLDNRLNQQINKAIELRDTGHLYDLPHAEERFADIMNEHRKQREIYVDITSEFEVQRQFESCSSSDDNDNFTKAIGNGVNEPISAQIPTATTKLPSSTTNQESDAQPPRQPESDL